MADLLAYGEDIIGFPGGEATAKVKLMDLLWENPNPAQAMASDTEISINDTNYDLLAYVCFIKSTNNKVIPLVLAPKNKDVYACYADSGNALQRRFDYANGIVTAKTGYIGSTADNTCIILYQIYGIKLEQEIPVVAENVSTLAANCLLSDGETSVGERVEANSFGTAVDISAYTSKNSPYECPSDGYIRVSTGTTSVSTQAVIREAIKDITLIAARPNGTFGAEGVLFVKKGMKIYVLANTASAGIYFIPLT